MSKKALWFALTLCGAMAFIILSGGAIKVPSRRRYVPSPSSVAAGQERLRFDGLYQAKAHGDTWLFLRFYPENDVMVLSAQISTADEVASVISRRRPEIGHGIYHLVEAQVAFTALEPLGSIDYKGTVGPESLVLFIHSHITGREESMKFGFQPTSFPSD